MSYWDDKEPADDPGGSDDFDDYWDDPRDSRDEPDGPADADEVDEAVDPAPVTSVFAADQSGSAAAGAAAAGAVGAGAAQASGGGGGGGPYDRGGYDDEPPAPRRAARLLEAAVAILVAVAVVALIVRAGDDDSGDGDGDEVSAEEEEDTTTSSRRTTSTTSASSTTTGLDPASTIAGSGSSTTKVGTGGGGGSSTTRRPTTTQTTQRVYEDLTLGCADGGGGAVLQPGADWPERWQTKPEPNDPATISVCVDDLTPRVGQEIEVRLVGQDADAIFTDADCGWLVFFGDGEPHPNCRPGGGVPAEPQPTPNQQFGRILRSAKHTYGSAGARTITASVVSAPWTGVTSPYSSVAVAEINITVHD
jgi:hypothetical protein